MTQFADSLALWLADFYLLTTVLLALALVGIAVLKQPAQRLAIAKATLMALALLAALCALPRWSVVHLLTAEPPAVPAASRNTPQPLPATATPVVKTTSPQEDITTGPIVRVQANEADGNQPAKPEIFSAIRWTFVLLMAYLIGAAAVLAWLVAGSIAASRLRLSAGPHPPPWSRS